MAERKLPFLCRSNDLEAWRLDVASGNVRGHGLVLRSRIHTPHIHIESEAA